MTDEFRQVQRNLARLPYIIRQKVVVNAERSAARVIAKQARAEVPVRTGLLRRSIGVAKARKRDTPTGVTRFYVLTKTKTSVTRKVTVGDRTGKLRAKLYAFYGHMVEFGTKNMDARPFLAPAARATTALVNETFRERINIEIEKELKAIA